MWMNIEGEWDPQSGCVAGTSTSAGVLGLSPPRGAQATSLPLPATAPEAHTYRGETDTQTGSPV